MKCKYLRVRHVYQFRKLPYHYYLSKPYFALFIWFPNIEYVNRSLEDLHIMMTTKLNHKDEEYYVIRPGKA